MTARPGADAHVPSLDGVRGLAIALVIARHLSLVPWFHASPNGVDRLVARVAGAGWIGVDLFFVLSGFLITGILLRERDRPAPMSEKLGRFYWRRFLRIVPLYYAACAVLFFVVPAMPYFRGDPALVTLHRGEAWYWTYAVNFLETFRAPGATPFNTGHLWSLSVEEQFYLVWPFVVLGLSRRMLPRVIAGLLVAGPLVRIALLVHLGSGNGPIAAYTLSVARLDVLGFGAMLALLRHGDIGLRVRPKWPAPWRAAAALAVLAFIALAPYWDESLGLVMQTIGYSVVAVGMGTLIAGALGMGGAPTQLARWFSVRPLRTLGKYSYCLYVVHYPLMAFFDLAWGHVHIAPLGGSRLPSWLAYGAALVTTSLIIAWASWRVLESPMLGLKDRWRRSGLPALNGRTSNEQPAPVRILSR